MIGLLRQVQRPQTVWVPTYPSRELCMLRNYVFTWPYIVGPMDADSKQELNRTVLRLSLHPVEILVWCH